ncbi:MAG: MBL fold metallo-hydrolase [Bdellovibrionales bacterium]|nr:MBL fold metallo-hydrolase [Bdellovibrionales bacterium]
MGLRVSRILHAGYLFESAGTKIAFDPIFENPFSRNCYAFPKVSFDRNAIRALQLDAVFISHYHDDHCSLESLNLLSRETAIYLYCIHDEMFEVIRKLGFKSVQPLFPNSPVHIGAFTITPRKALDPDVDSIFQIQADGFNILNVVDSWIDPIALDNLVQQAPWDLVLWPFQTMLEVDVLSPSRASPASRELPPEWIEQIKSIGPRAIVPSSCQFIHEDWSWYNHALFPITYRQFEKEIRSALPKTEVIRMNPSTSVVLERGAIRPSAPLTWVKPIGEQNVDYEFRADAVPTSTREIANHFSPLTAEQSQRVHQYCEKEILERYRDLGSSQDPYFRRPRRWRLSLYDQDGSVVSYSYLLEHDDIIIQDTPDGTIEWRTDVPIAKLYAALELGESLTSMYMRINDQPFSSTIEADLADADLADADLLEDPLLRCLFSRDFASYQLAQMRHLMTPEPKPI